MEKELELFENYIKNFDLNKKGIYYKYKHTFRTVSFAEEIARSLNLSEEDINLSKICALFHDIGRFSQYTEFGTFNDLESIDHGDRGEEVLKELDYKNDIVLKAVKLHNKIYLPDGLGERESLFCKIVRDADKIDIMIEQATTNEDEKYYLDEENKNRLLNCELLKSIDNNNDSLKMYKRIAFIFDLNFKRSFEIINEKNLINKKMDIIIDKFPNDETKMFKEFFNNYVNKQLENI